jgi:YggT family protein
MSLVHTLLYLYFWVLFLTAVLSWFPSSGGLAGVQRVLRALTEPVLRPLRAILPRPHVGGVGIDLSVLIAMVLVQVINRVI